MINSIRRFFRDHIGCETSDKTSQAAIHLATAALMIEVMLSDGQADPGELEAIRRQLLRQFNLAPKLLDELIELSRQEVVNATSLYEFTAEVNRHFRRQQKLELITSLWRVAFADDKIDKYEEALIRKITDLLHVSHSDFILAKHNARPGRI